MRDWPLDYYKENTIVIRGNNGILYKILKISPQSDGGINVFMPYCREKQGYLTMPVIDYRKRNQKIRHSDLVGEFFVDKDSKMSIHQSGFVQFSGNGIISGIDKDTGEVKGCGVFSSPLATPVTSGPTFSMTLWGVENGFKEATKEKKGEKLYIFEEPNYFIRNTRQGPKEGIIFDFFIFSTEYRHLIYKKDGNLYITWRFWNHVIPGIIMTMRVILIENQDSFIAVLPSKDKVDFPEFEFGYALCGPTGNLQKNSKKFSAIACTYPRIILGDENVPSLMRV